MNIIQDQPFCGLKAGHLRLLSSLPLPLESGVAPKMRGVQPLRVELRPTFLWFALSGTVRDPLGVAEIGI